VLSELVPGVLLSWRKGQSSGAPPFSQRLRQTTNEHDCLAKKIPNGSLLALIATRDYLKSPIALLTNSICTRLKAAIPLTFQNNPPKDEPDLNDKVSAILNAERTSFEREHPAIRFALGSVIPDHSWHEQHLLLETKYVRGATSPSKSRTASQPIS
jgi:hypothetical protein